MSSSIPSPQFDAPDWQHLSQQIKQWGQALGFAEIRITDTKISKAETGLEAWLAQGMHGSMDYMARHGSALRAYPENLVPGTLRIISARMNYLPSTPVSIATIPATTLSSTHQSETTPHSAPADWRANELSKLDNPEQAVVSIYARGRDYHKVLRNKLQQLAEKIRAHTLTLGYRVFTDSAPVMEVELAQKAGLGWRGKHTLLLSRTAGSMFFLGEIFVDIPLPCDEPTTDHCGQCQRCLTICPTQAIIAPYQLDARRCISYLTIEHDGAIPEEFRPLLGNRIYGCDDCQLVCPWNKYAQTTSLPDFMPRHDLDNNLLLTLFAWTEQEFLDKLSGSPIRRIGHIRWLRNIAIALGNARRNSDNADYKKLVQAALHNRLDHPSALVREHVRWALQ